MRLPAPTLRSARLRLRPFADVDANDLFALHSNEVVMRYWAFDALDLNRVQAEVDTRNHGSAHVLEKLGFVREGTLREDCIVNGEISDSWVFGLLRRQWRPASDTGNSR